MEPVSYFILAVYLVILFGIGAYFSRKQHSLSDFFLAGRSIPAWAAMAAIVATETSAITFIGAPAIAFREGGDLSFLQVALGYIFARVILSFYFLPRFFENEIVTIYSFLGIRFGPLAQKVAGLFFFVTRALAAGVRHYAAALVISAVTDIDLTTAIIMTGIASFAYSIMGGISAVIWTEVVQLAVMIAGGLLGFYYLLDLIPGGWQTIFETGNLHQKFTVVHLDWHDGWNSIRAYPLFIGFLGGFCLSLASHGADQDMVQRLLSCRNLRGAQKAMIWSGIFIFFQFTFFLTLGILLFVYYGTLPPELEKTDEIFPYFASQNMNPIAAGLVIAAILSAALSSTASALNSLSSTSVSDFVLPHLNRSIDNRQIVRISRGFTIFWTIILIVIATVASQSENIFDTGLSIPSYTYGSLLAAFLIGIFTRFKNELCVILGMCLGVIVVLFFSYCGFHWTWFVPIGATSTILTAFIIERLFRKQAEHKHKEHLFRKQTEHKHKFDQGRK